MRVRKIAKKTISFVVSVRPSFHMEQLGSQWPNFYKVGYLNIFRNSLNKFEFHYNLTRRMCNLHEDLRTFMINSRVSDKFVEKIKTHISCSIFFFESCAIFEIMWKSLVQPGRPQMTI
jgi:hypothetical protein